MAQVDKQSKKIKDLESRDTVSALNNVTRKLISDIVKEI